MAATIPDLMRAGVLTVWNERDPERRTAAIARLYAEDVVVHEPTEVLHGRAGVHAAVQRLLDGSPGWVFTPGPVTVTDDLGRLEWQFGPEGAAPVVLGTDVALVEGGLVRHLYVLLAPPSEREVAQAA